MTDLTVVCAFRDAAEYLPDLLASFQRMTSPTTQFVFVDDASTDRSLEVVDAVSDRLPGAVDVIENTTAAGPASGRNQGMRIADGRWIAFVDGDDWVGRSYFFEMIEWAERLDVDFVRCDHVRVFPDRRSIARASDRRYYRRLDPSSAVLPTDQATMVDFPYSHSGLFSRRLVDNGVLEMPSHLRTAEDRPWIWRLHLEAESYARIESLQYFYRRQVDTSLTQVGDDRQLDFIPSFRMVLEYVYARPDAAVYSAKAVRQCLSVIHHHLINADRLESGLEQRMRTSLVELLEGIPDADLSLALRDIGWRRADLIRDLDRRLQRL